MKLFKKLKCETHFPKLKASFIESLALAMSSIPYCAVAGMQWDDAIFLPMSRSLRSPRELASPFLGSCISKVQMICEEIQETGEKMFVIQAESEFACRKTKAKVRLYLSIHRGLVRLVREQDECTSTYSLMSFEVSL